MRRRFRRVALAVSAVVVVAIAGGVTYAVADIGSGGVINGCYKSVNGQLRLIDPATDSCNPSETPISWGQTGTQGPQGPPGPAGPQGPPGPTDLSKFSRAAANAQTAVLLNNGGDFGYVTELSTNLTSGSSPGFVVVHANMGAYTTSLAECPCQIEFRVRYATAGSGATDSFAQVGNVADAEGFAIDNGAVSGVFPIGANQTHQYDFQAVVDDNGGTPSVSANISMTAVYVPFNGAGTATVLAALTPQAARLKPRAARANPAAARRSSIRTRRH
jgi:hypothetical protein